VASECSNFFSFNVKHPLIKPHILALLF
jgi:hypothetical protein